MSTLSARLTGLVTRRLPRRIPLFYLILIVLLLLSVVPLLVFRWKVGSSSRQKLETNEQILQTTVTGGIAEETQLYVRTMELQIDSLVRLLESTGAIEDVADPNYAETLDRAIAGFVGKAENVLFLTIVNPEQRGRQGGVTAVGQDEFINQRLSDAFQAGQFGHAFHSGAFLVKYGEDTPVMVMARPLTAGHEFRGMVATVVSLEFLRQRLIDSSRGGLVTYVVNRSGRLIIHPNGDQYTVGQDMSQIPIVQDFLAGTQQVSATRAFDLMVNGQRLQMLGTQVAVPDLDWAVIAQKPVDQAYFAVYQMHRLALLLVVALFLLSALVGYISARLLTTPLQVLAETTRAIAKGDFSRRVNLPSRTEIGELADTFNLMADDLEQYVERLKQAAQENHELFLGSIRTLGAAIDEKD
ncbi:MAG: HAMP domain-containing protein, partial [Terriglobia bacterium]